MNCSITLPGVRVSLTGSQLAAHPSHCPKDLKFHHFMVTSDKAFPELHIPQQPLLAGWNKVPHSPSITWRRKLSSMHFRNLLDCLCLAVLSPQQTLRWLKFPIQARNRECSYLSIVGLICSVLLVRWPVADPHYKNTSPSPPLNPDP